MILTRQAARRRMACTNVAFTTHLRCRRWRALPAGPPAPRRLRRWRSDPRPETGCSRREERKSGRQANRQAAGQVDEPAEFPADSRRTGSSKVINLTPGSGSSRT